MGAFGSKSTSAAPAATPTTATAPSLFGSTETPPAAAPGTAALGGRRRFRKVKTHRRRKTSSMKGRTGRKSSRS